jgi:surface antigen
MRKIKMISVGVILGTGLAVSLSGCAPGYNTPGATAVGAGLGGIVGAAAFGPGSWAGIIGGALVGGIVGNQIGQSMDRADARRAYAAYTSDTRRTSWSNNGNYYTVERVKTYRHRGRYCREYRTTARIGDKRRVVYGKACRMPDGSWKVV